MLYNPNKKGTIILSHYRSGGTQLLATLWLGIGEKNTTNFSEWKGKDVDEFNNLLKSANKYSIILLNNPLSITKFYQNGLFNKLNDEYQIVVLERKNKVNCLLSYELWEKFIEEGLYENKESKWDKDTMLNFHNKTIGKLFIRDINERIKNFIMDIYFIQKIQKEFNLPKIYYEDYEYDKKYLASCFDGIDKEHILKVSKICDKKIPYISKNYLDYYSKRTKLCVSEWKLDEL